MNGPGPESQCEAGEPLVGEVHRICDGPRAMIPGVRGDPRRGESEGEKPWGVRRGGPSGSRPCGGCWNASAPGSDPDRGEAPADPTVRPSGAIRPGYEARGGHLIAALPLGPLTGTRGWRTEAGRRNPHCGWTADRPSRPRPSGGGAARPPRFPAPSLPRSPTVHRPVRPRGSLHHEPLHLELAEGLPPHDRLDIQTASGPRSGRGATRRGQDQGPAPHRAQGGLDLHGGGAEGGVA